MSPNKWLHMRPTNHRDRCTLLSHMYIVPEHALSTEGRLPPELMRVHSLAMGPCSRRAIGSEPHVCFTMCISRQPIERYKVLRLQLYM